MSTTFHSVYLIGIGGMGMCPLAIFLSELGIKVFGMDDDLKPEIRNLLDSKGVNLEYQNNIPSSCQCIIYSHAISPEHPLYVQATQRNIPHFNRGVFLSNLLKDKKLIAVVGSHGKTTTAGLLIHTLQSINWDFSYLMGALFKDQNKYPAHYSPSSDWVVAEIDESNDTINFFNPAITLVVNFDWDHPTAYKTQRDLENTFASLFSRTKEGILIPEKCSILKKISKSAKCKVLTYGNEETANYQGTLEISRPTNILHFQKTLKITLPDNSLFNTHNCLAALAATQLVTARTSADSFKKYSGIRRRQETLYENDNLLVMMDYAHHPTEIDALLTYIRSIDKNKILAIFQPHRYSRTKAYFKDFASSLSKADEILLLPVYAACEPFLEDGTSKAIFDSFTDNSSKLKQLPYSFPKLLEHLPNTFSPKKLSVIFIGAGNIEKLAFQYRDYLKHSDWWNSIASRVSAETELSLNEPLGKKTTLLLGGNARFFAKPANLEDLLTILKSANQAQVPIFPLGRGSNLIVPDDGFDGLVIHLSHTYWKEIKELGEGRLYVGAGARLKEICGFACKYGLAGFEFLEGIPGSLGGSLRMNAGAMGSWLFTIVESIKRVTLDGKVEELPKESLTIGYRHCSDLKDSIAIGATLKSPAVKDTSIIRQTIEDYSKHRKPSQPREPSAGCIFKNPEGNHAGKLIDEAGLKGTRIGNAEVSTIHANFIINRGGATSKDMVELIRYIRSKVKDKSNITLEPEVLFLGKNWEQELN